jgi:hypothetical protein
MVLSEIIAFFPGLKEIAILGQWFERSGKSVILENCAFHQ